MSIELTGAPAPRLFPEAIESSARSWLTRAVGCGLVAFAAMSWLGLLSWSAIDPIAPQAGAAAGRNLLGPTGAAISDLFAADARHRRRLRPHRADDLGPRARDGAASARHPPQGRAVPLRPAGARRRLLGYSDAAELAAAPRLRRHAGRSRVQHDRHLDDRRQRRAQRPARWPRLVDGRTCAARLQPRPRRRHPRPRRPSHPATGREHACRDVGVRAGNTQR